MSEDHQKHHPVRYDGRTDPDSIAPDDEERAAGPEGPSVDIVLRALSVLPFLLVAAVGLIAIISWVLIVVFGVGSGEPVWEAVQGLSATELVWQLFLAVVIGVVPVLVTLGASWATAHGFRERRRPAVLDDDPGGVGSRRRRDRVRPADSRELACRRESLGARLVVRTRRGSVRDRPGGGTTPAGAASHQGWGRMSETRRKKDAGQDGRTERLRSLAAVDEVLREPAVEDLLARYPRALVVDAVRAVLDRLRTRHPGGGGGRRGVRRPGGGPHAGRPHALGGPPARGGRHAVVAARHQRHRRRRAHQPGRGRLLPRAAVEAVVTAAMSYSDLEYGLALGERASRQDHIHDVLCTVTGAEARSSSTTTPPPSCSRWPHARGGEVLVSRGQLVEIGGSFRMPDVMPAERRGLVEVGTTNRTPPQDYEARLDRPHPGDAARAHQQLPHHRVHRPSRRSRSWRAGARAWPV